MELRQLKTFAAIVRHGSFTAAAQTLDYAQSTVTSQIQALEAHLDTKLFERLGRNATLTSAGETLYGYAEKLLNLALEAELALADATLPKGRLIVGVPESLCVNRLPTLFKEYQELFPAVEIQLRFDSCSNFRACLRNGELDVAIFLEVPLAEPDLTIYPLFAEPMAILAAPHHPLTQKSCVAPQDLNGQALLLTEGGCSYRHLFDDMLRAYKIMPRSILEIDSVEVLRQFALSGLGLTFLSRQFVSADLASGRLIALPWSGPDFPITAQLIHHREKWLSPALKAFINLLLKRLGNKPLLNGK